MQITYDKEADAVYIAFCKGVFARNHCVDSFTILDLDEGGEVLGIELLQVSKRFSVQDFATLSVKNIAVVSQSVA